MIVAANALVVTLAVAAAPSFTERSVQAGLAYSQHAPQTPPNCIFISGNFCEPERMSGGVAVGDVDGDGWPDLFFTRLDGPDRLFINQQNGLFQEGTAAAGLSGYSTQSNGAAFADVDNDGDLDLYVALMGDSFDSANNRNLLFINNGAGGFAEDASVRGADDPDLSSRRTYSVGVGDYDGDGWVDLHVNEWKPVSQPRSRLLRNRGVAAPGHFEDRTTAADVELDGVDAFASGLVDLDGDGCVDLAVAADFGTSRLFWGDCSGGFTDGTEAAGVGSDENGMGSTIADYDGDGDLDWFVTSIYDAADTCSMFACGWGATGNRLYRNEGGRVFSDATDEAGVRDGAWGWGTAFADFDNDGDRDLVMTNGVDFPGGSLDAPFNQDRMRLWVNEGPGRPMTESSVQAGVTDTGSGKGLAVVDYDRDGDLDIVVVNNGDVPRLYRNDTGNQNDWLRVRAVGDVSNREGLGARVRVDDGTRTQVGVIGSVSHFLGQSETIAHFGLGSPSGDPVPQVRVLWPSGLRQAFTDVARNTLLVVDESDCTDVDGDLHCTSFDCDDSDAAIFPEGAEINDGIDNQCPGEVGYGVVDETSGVSGFADPGDGDTYSWPAQAGATMYQVARSTRPDLASDCTVVATADTSWTDATRPQAGTVFYYLNRAAAPLSGSWGARSDGTDRQVCGLAD